MAKGGGGEGKGGKSPVLNKIKNGRVCLGQAVKKRNRERGKNSEKPMEKKGGKDPARRRVLV